MALSSLKNSDGFTQACCTRSYFFSRLALLGLALLGLALLGLALLAAEIGDWSIIIGTLTLNGKIQENKMCLLPNFLSGTLLITSKEILNRSIAVYPVCNYCYTDCDTGVAGCHNLYTSGCKLDKQRSND